MRLSEYVLAVREKTLELLEDERFPADQRELLRRAVLRLFELASPGDFAQPLGLLYAVYRGFGRKTDAQTRLVGVFCVCYLTSFDLFDDVQDDDLAGKPLEAAGAPIAINSALALLLVGLRALGEAAELEKDPARRGEYMTVFNRASLVAVGAQHTDLAGSRGLPSPADVLAMNRAKTSSVALLTECGALLGGAGPEMTAVFREFGSDFAALVQIVDDVRDLFGKEHSPDLLTGKITYPIACFLAAATPSQRADYDALRGQLPESAEALRELLHAAGAVDAAATATDELRRLLHDRLSQLASPRAEHRLLLSMVDTLASALYEPERIPESLAFRKAEGGFHDDLARASRRFLQTLDLERVLPLPLMMPWPAPLYLFEPDTFTVRYPDLQDLPLEVAGQFADALGLDLDQTFQAMMTGMPLLLAHELFHAWRHSSGRLSADAWHEEFVANRLAMGYALRFEPEAARATIEMSQLILSRVPADIEETAILRRARAEGPPADYELSFSAAARLHARMLLDAAAECDFELDQAIWLSRESRLDAPSDEWIAAE